MWSQKPINPKIWVSWRLRRTNDTVPVGRQEEANGTAQRPSCRKNALLFGARSAFLFRSGPQLIGWGLPTPGRAICFISLLIQMWTSSRNILTDITENNVPNVWAHHSPVIWHIKVTITTPYMPSRWKGKGDQLTGEAGICEEQITREEKHTSDPRRKGPSPKVPPAPSI